MRKIFYKVTWSRSTLTSGGRPPAWVSKVIFTCFGPCFEEKHGSGMKYICFISMDCRCKKWYFVVCLLITSGEWAKNLRFFGKKDSAASSKLHSTFCRRKFEEKIVFRKKHNVLHFSGLSAKNCLVMDEKFWVALLESHSTCLANVSIKLDFLNVFFTIIWLGAEGSRNSSRKFPAGLSELHYTCPEDHFEKRFFYGRIIFTKLFLDQECKLFALLKIFSAVFLDMNSICPEDYLAKKFLGRIVKDFVKTFVL